MEQDGRSDERKADADPDGHRESAAHASAALVSVRLAQNALVLRNDSGRRVGCVVVDAELMMIAQFPPSGAAMIALEPGAEATVPFAEILGHTADSRMATLHCWPLRAHGEPLDADDYVRSSEVTLRS